MLFKAKPKFVLDMFLLLFMNLTVAHLESVQILFVAESFECQRNQYICFLASLG